MKNRTHKMAHLLNCLALAGTLSLYTASSALAATAAAKHMTLDVDQGSGAVTFDAIGRPSALKIHGKGDAPKGQLKVAAGKLSGTCTFKLDSLDTGIGKRNEHMKKRYLETDKYPEAKLTFNDLALPANYAAESFSEENLPFKGVLSLHGVDKPVSGTAKVARNGKNLDVLAKFPFKISEYSIPSPSFAGVTMAEDVNVSVQIAAPFRAQ